MNTPLVSIDALTKRYHQHGGDVLAVRGVHLDILRDQTVALVGESGCGKATLGRALAGLTTPTSGTILVDGTDAATLAGRDRRRRVQMVFQHPKQSLNPRFTIEATLDEPLRMLTDLDRRARSARVDELLDQVGLPRAIRRRRPERLSGGQQQRVAIARALACSPEIVVLDEPTSALDQSVRVLIIDLLARLQADRRMSYLLITHDLVSARAVADHVAVMYLGKIVESGPAAEVFANPLHPYTVALLAAAPARHPADRGRTSIVAGETPDPRVVPDGCAFADRCPLVQPTCRTGAIELLPATDQRQVACPVVLSLSPSSTQPTPAHPTPTEAP